ncbi:hypothetical protein WME98_15680 [Sorangium sp. So ce296]|uniref:hypothetical protein n=1 Tax=Sorangium sp. So ce296 TaxID=3133296 RepID=UPI003F61529E
MADCDAACAPAAGGPPVPGLPAFSALATWPLAVLALRSALGLIIEDVALARSAEAAVSSPSTP